MIINKSIKIALAVVLCLAMLLPFIPGKNTPVVVEADAATVNFEDTVGDGSSFKGKKLSILGDSISTYEGVPTIENFILAIIILTEASFGIMV